MKPKVIGIYGLPGSGKTHLLNHLREKLAHQGFSFYDGSDIIDSVVSGGLSSFKQLSSDEKKKYRELAIAKVSEDHGCHGEKKGQVAVVAGHFMLSSSRSEVGNGNGDGDGDGGRGQDGWEKVVTKMDGEVYTHVIYLRTDVDLLARRRMLDETRKDRSVVRTQDLALWQEEERIGLQEWCYDRKTLFSEVMVEDDGVGVAEQVAGWLLDFQRHDEIYNLGLVEREIDEWVAEKAKEHKMTTVLVMDADKTLAPEDTGMLFWTDLSSSDRLSHSRQCAESPLGDIFSSRLGYSYEAFRQATMLHESYFNHTGFDDRCKVVASKTQMYRDFVALLREAAEHKHVGMVILTSGLRRVWERVLQQEGLMDVVSIIGGGRIDDGLVVTAEAKRAVVERLQDHHEMFVSAFGDGPLDIGMLQQANKAIVVVGSEQNRSRSMEKRLEDAIEFEGLQAMQVLIPVDVSPRLTISKLPIVELTDKAFIQSVLNDNQIMAIEVQHATDKHGTALLTAPTRDARVIGPLLRKAHRRIGKYLAIEYLSSMIGKESYPIPHVQGHHVEGHRLLDEEHTLIIALMRGGEPMALAISEIFPLAPFLHAKTPEDITPAYLKGQRTILLVDSVINNGKTMIEFVNYLFQMKLQPKVRIVLVTNVAQAGSISRIQNGIKNCDTSLEVSLVAFRLSDNQYTGAGDTDTGNRLFNTTSIHS